MGTALVDDSALHQCIVLSADHLRPPAWKRLINPTLTPHERISLIMAIFSDQKEVEMVRRLCGDDAQVFIDSVDEVRHHVVLPRKDEWVDSFLCSVG